MSSVIGVDVGGTKVVASQLRRNELGESVLDPTDRSDSRALIDQLVAMVNRIRGDDLESVGIGVPSTVEFETGRVVSSVNIPLVDVPLRQVLGERLGVPVATGGAGELGHTIVGLGLGDSEPVPEPNGFPQSGSLDYVAAGHALDRMASESAAAVGASAPAGPKAGGTPVLGTDAVAAARARDPAASRIVEIWAERVGIGVANAINTFDPHEVVIGAAL